MGQPGHHVQLALQQEMALPAFRKRAWIKAHGEGWALHAEMLGTAWPAQALGSKLGSLKIQAPRKPGQQRLGARFSLAAFHDAVLAEGSLPLSILEARIERWIEEQV